MFCTNCGIEMNDGAAICVSCGFAKGTGVNYCGSCGAQRNAGAVVCVKCGCALNSGSSAVSEKTKSTAGLLYILLGTLGIGDFYLGYTGRGVIKLLLTFLVFLVGWIASLIWSIIDGIKCFNGKMTDARGLRLKD